MTTTLGPPAPPRPAARATEPTALRDLLPREQDVLFRAALRLTRRRDEAADLVQETCLRALGAERRLDLRPFGLRPWLLTILRNVFLNERGRRRRGREVPLGDSAVALPGPVPGGRPARDEPLDWEQVDERLKAAVESLPGRHRDVLLRRVVDGRSYGELAADLDIPVGTVMSRLHRARQLVAASLGAAGPASNGKEAFSFNGRIYRPVCLLPVFVHPPRHGAGGGRGRGHQASPSPRPAMPHPRLIETLID